MQVKKCFIFSLQGAFSEPGAKTVIPRKVIGKFSVRIVPNQTPEIVEKVVLVRFKAPLFIGIRSFDAL